VAVLDISMPLMNGLEAACEMHRDHLILKPSC
jgi:hypothetical protein